jgi:hypothetical protein
MTRKDLTGYSEALDAPRLEGKPDRTARLMAGLLRGDEQKD